MGVRRGSEKIYMTEDFLFERGALVGPLLRPLQRLSYPVCKQGGRVGISLLNFFIRSVPTRIPGSPAVKIPAITGIEKSGEGSKLRPAALQ